jgi:DNA mismatch repair ATPase MutS
MLFFTLYLFFSLATRNQVATTFQKAHDLAQNLAPLRPIIQTVENYHLSDWSQKYLKKTLELKLTHQLNSLSRLTSFLSVQAHPLMHLGLNAICPWDYILSFLVERWRLKLNQHLPLALEELSNLEVWICQALFYKFHTQTWPQFNHENVFEFEKAFHPLLGVDKAVANSFTKPTPECLTLITGSNMSGKSTFLRTFGINHQLAIIGCPVFAGSMNTALVDIRTCLKVQDSLEKGLSTFYYEVRQVSSMLTAAKNREPFVYLIDEIFRGTNNKERLIGSKAVIAELLKYNVPGFMSTHDLELAHLADTNPRIQNYHFKDDVSDSNELVFSYKIQPGPCPTTNALKILNREGIPISESP